MTLLVRVRPAIDMRATAKCARTPRSTRDAVTRSVLLEDDETGFEGIQSRVLRSTRYFDCKSVVEYARLDDNARIPFSTSALRRQRRCRNFLSALDLELNHPTRPLPKSARAAQ